MVDVNLLNNDAIYNVSRDDTEAVNNDDKNANVTDEMREDKYYHNEPFNENKFGIWFIFFFFPFFVLI